MISRIYQACLGRQGGGYRCEARPCLSLPAATTALHRPPTAGSEIYKRH